MLGCSLTPSRDCCPWLRGVQGIAPPTSLWISQYTHKLCHEMRVRWRVIFERRRTNGTCPFGLAASRTEVICSFREDSTIAAACRPSDHCTFIAYLTIGKERCYEGRCIRAESHAMCRISCAGRYMHLILLFPVSLVV